MARRRNGSETVITFDEALTPKEEEMLRDLQKRKKRAERAKAYLKEEILKRIDDVVGIVMEEKGEYMVDRLVDNEDTRKTLIRSLQDGGYIGNPGCRQMQDDKQ